MTTTDTDALTEKIRDEVAGITIGSGYYSTSIGVDEAAEVAAAVLPLVAAEMRRGAAGEALDRAEHRIARLEAQTDIRGRAVVIYRERARQAEARIKAVEDVLDQAWEEFDNVDASDIRRALESDTPPRTE